MALPYLACMIATAGFYHLPPRVLPSIQAAEGGRPGLVHPNTDGTSDYGLMQINTRWVGPIADFTHQTRAATTWRLIMDPCFGIAAAGAILRVYIAETRGDLMRAIGDYHSHTPPLNEAYQLQVMARARALFEARR
jgi:hypothetical protein